MRLAASDILEGLLRRDRAMLARAITLVESTRPEDRERAMDLIDLVLPHTGQSIRIGVTGVPGVGKSTFIEAFGLHAIETTGNGVAVLAIDPSSPVSGGSIMGDKTRMARLSAHPKAFIRPSPSGGGMGGVQERTRETILLCEAAGFETILVETVGVGQSEVAAASMTDFFLLLLLANAGDELQGIKRGIVELCDLIAINKADGGNEQAAALARKQYETALHYLRAGTSGWHPPVVTCSALTGANLDGIWNEIQRYIAITAANGYFAGKRARQRAVWMEDALRTLLQEQVRNSADAIRERVLKGELNPARAARMILASSQKCE
jgi:LAO/AO transport system kinase